MNRSDLNHILRGEIFLISSNPLAALRELFKTLCWSDCLASLKSMGYLIDYELALMVSLAEVLS